MTDTDLPPDESVKHDGPRRIVIEEVIRSSVLIPGQPPSPGGWKVSQETARDIPEEEFAAVLLTIATSVLIPRLLSENARLKAQVSMLSAAALKTAGMEN
jgi:hypothetical protein